MAEGKVIGKLTNIVNFSTDKASLNKVLADIKKVKDAMKGVTQPFAKVQQQMTRANKQQARMKSDYLVVQKQLDKTEKSQLKTAEAIYKAKNKQALAEQKITNQRRAQSVRGLTTKSGAGRASQTAFADMLRQEERASKLATRAAATANNRNMRVDRRAQATQEWFGDTFGRGGSKKAAGLYNDMRAGKISAEQYSSRLRTLRAELYRNQRAQRGFNQSIHDMRGAFVQATATYTAFAGVMGIADVGKKFQGYQSSLSMAFGGEQESAPYVEYLRKEIRRLGLDIQTTTDDFSKLAVAASGKLQGGDLKSLFSGYMEYANVAGASAERISNGVVAMQQMLSKGRIAAEEFNF